MWGTFVIVCYVVEATKTEAIRKGARERTVFGLEGSD